MLIVHPYTLRLPGSILAPSPQGSRAGYAELTLNELGNAFLTVDQFATHGDRQLSL
jgi:hypothetical protein